MSRCRWASPAHIDEMTSTALVSTGGGRVAIASAGAWCVVVLLKNWQEAPIARPCSLVSQAIVGGGGTSPRPCGIGGGDLNQRLLNTMSKRRARRPAVESETVASAGAEQPSGERSGRVHRQTMTEVY